MYSLIRGDIVLYEELIDYKGYIYLTSIYEPQDNKLILEIERCKVNDEAEGIQVGDVVIEDCHSIDVDQTLPILQIEFDWYIAYTVRNESFTTLDEYEVFEGGVFSIYSKSRYLDFIEVSTIASDDHPGPFKHYGINALNHIIDVVSTEPPTISFINRTVQKEEV
jgi:hypothetical protein